jgi:DNA polymerase-3 subunit delta'
MQFKNIPGNHSVKNQLLLAFKHQRLSHAHLFLGEDGSAVLPLAWAFSQFLICENKQENDSCGECSSCLKCSKLSHPDLHWVFPVTTGRGTNAISDHFISDWRESALQNPYQSEEEWYQHIDASNKQGFISVAEASELSKKMVLKSFEGSYRVVIIWHAEKMHAPTANKLLKLLEEPPEKTIFILLTPQILKNI